MITSHDRWFLDRIATHILAWEGGSDWFWFEGNFESYEKNKIERLGAGGGAAARGHLPQADPGLSPPRLARLVYAGLSPRSGRPGPVGALTRLCAAITR